MICLQVRIPKHILLKFMQSLKTELPGNPKKKECLVFRQKTLDPMQPKPFKFAAHPSHVDLAVAVKKCGRKPATSVEPANKYNELVDKQLAALFRASWPYRKSKTSKRIQ